MNIQLSPPRKPASNKKKKKKTPPDPKTLIIDNLLKNPKTKKLILEMINDNKELIDEYEAREKATPVNKVKHAVICESPTAYLRRRANQDKLRVRLDFSDTYMDNILKNANSAKPKAELLHGVLAYVEIHNDGEDHSDKTKALLKSLGGSVANRIGKGVTHVIFKGGRYETYKAAKHFKVILVSPLWLDVIDASGIRVTAEKFPALHAPAASCESICEKLKARRSLSQNSTSRQPNISQRRTLLPAFTMTVNDNQLLDDYAEDLISDDQSTATTDSDALMQKTPSTNDDQSDEQSTSQPLLNNQFITVRRKTTANFIRSPNESLKESNKKAVETPRIDSPLQHSTSTRRLTRQSTRLQNILNHTPSPSTNKLTQSAKQTRTLTRSKSDDDKSDKENNVKSQSSEYFTAKSTNSSRQSKLHFFSSGSNTSKCGTTGKSRQTLGKPRNCTIAEDSGSVNVDMEITENIEELVLNTNNSIRKKQDTKHSHFDMEFTNARFTNDTIESDLSNQQWWGECRSDKRIADANSKRSSTSTVRTSASDELVSYLPKRLSVRIAEQNTKMSTDSSNLSLHVSCSPEECTHVNIEQSASNNQSNSLSLRVSDAKSQKNEDSVPSLRKRKSNDTDDDNTSAKQDSPAKLNKLIDKFVSIVVSPGRKQNESQKSGEEPNIANKTTGKGKRKLYDPDVRCRGESSANDDKERQMRILETYSQECATSLDLHVSDSRMKLQLGSGNVPRSVRSPANKLTQSAEVVYDDSDNETFVELTQCTTNQKVTSLKNTLTQRNPSKSFTQTQNVKMRKRYIACTRLNKEVYAKFKRTVRKLQGFIIESNVTSKTTHLVASESCLTMNLLRAMCQGIWILNINWVLESDRIGKWDTEEFYEMTEFSPLIQQNRLRRENFGKAFSHDVFVDCGPMYIADGIRPSKNDLTQIISLCQGTIVDNMSAAEYLIGVPSRLAEGSQLALIPSWIMDCIVAGRIKNAKKYRMPQRI